MNIVAKSEKQNQWVLIAIVAIVAIVSIVFLVTSNFKIDNDITSGQQFYQVQARIP